MSHQMGHGFGHGRTGASDECSTEMPMVPAPMAFFGMVMAFMFGAVVGMKKASMTGGHGMHGMGMHGMGMHGMGMHGGGWPGKHHHHGWGMPPCRSMHEEEPKGAQGEQSAEDDER